MPCGAGSQSGTIPYFLSRRNQGDPRGSSFLAHHFLGRRTGLFSNVYTKVIFKDLLKTYKVIPRHHIKSNTLVLGRKFSLLILFHEYYDVAKKHAAIILHVLFVLGAYQEWFQTILLTVFTLADIVARFLTHLRVGLNYRNIYWTAIVRVLLLPLMIYCAVSKTLGCTLNMLVVD